MAIDRRNINIRTKIATDAAMFLASRLRRVGIDVRVLSREHAERVRESSSDGEEFSVADMQKESYVWNGEAVSLAAFARSFMSHIKQKDRTVEDANRIAEAYIKNVAEDPSKHIPALLPENMSHARYFILRDGSVFGPDNAAWNSPEYQTTRGLYEIYLRVLGEDRMRDYLRLVNPSYLRNDEENARFLSMEREVNGSSLMQSSLELNAEKISAERVRAVRNIIQYFDGNNDYMPLEKALLLKGAMTWGVVDKKDGEKTDIRLVRITDSNDLSVPVIGGDLASVVEGLRHGMDFKDSLREAIKNRQNNGRRSVPGSYTGWKRYPKSDCEEDAAVLNKDVAGTGWCTGGALSTARSHLSGGDFHVFFENGEPLIAIRTENGRMAEPPRGAHEGQFCTDREEQIAFDYITNPVNGIVAGKEYVNDILDIRRIMSPDATWKDAFNFPLQRRYSNGEFGGDTSSWGDKINQRVDELLDGVSSSERRRLGYYLADEVSAPGSDLSEVKYVRGDIIVFNDCCFPSLQSIGGHLNVGENATLQADALRSVGGYLNVGENATLQADALRSVGGYLDIRKNASLQADALQNVGRYLIVYPEATLQADALQSIGINLYVYEHAIIQANALQSVGGDLVVLENAIIQADALQSVGGYLDVGKNATLQANALQSVGGDLFVRENAILQADALQSVGGHLFVRENAILQADALQSVGGYLDISINAKDVHIGIDYSLRDGTVYGYAIGDVIYLTPDGINPETPIHEYTHLWARVLEKNSPEQWAELVDSLRNSVEWSVVYNDSYYSNIRNDDSRLASEVLARLCGRKGAELLQRAAGESDGTVAGTVSEFRRLVDSNVMPAVFGTKGERLTEKATLAVLQDFAEGRRNSLAEVSMMPGSYPDIRTKNSSGDKITGIRRHH